ncbi:hypothetical protein CHS0354_013156 [Potamilus streckersoni]|uniref:CN hydrolase domain-containing protein n=1 Tax=Potamilus streckersoni TaxID=2493646 RepID=A0AAE0W822_9BIVA|nr:hypothetical protein CHS0354_013156 [Potamilus streckersoni]
MCYSYISFNSEITEDMMMTLRVFLALILPCVLGVTKNTYRAAVYEHVIISPINPTMPCNRSVALALMKRNLEVYERQAKYAASLKVDIMVFPEYGITGFDQTRDSMIPYLENIPDPSVVWNPCLEQDRFPECDVQIALSCMARNYHIYIVANMGDIKHCDFPNDQFCPTDGRFQFNTNVIYDKNGTFVARYHKRNLWDESPLFDGAPVPEFSTFDTPYGKFGTVVCADMLFQSPTQDLIRHYSLKNLFVTAAWNVFFPYVIPTQMFAGLSKLSEINLIVSNARSKENKIASSGIFSSNRIANVSGPDFDSPDGVFLSADLPFQPEVTSKKTNTTIDKQTVESVGSEISFEQSDHMGFQYSYKLLSKLAADISVCKGKACCRLVYEFANNSKNELYVLGVTDSGIEEPGLLHLQACTVYRCEGKDKSSCNKPITSAKSTFSKIILQGNFTAKFVIPQVLTVPQNGTYSMEIDSYTYDKEKNLLISAGFQNPVLSILLLGNTLDTNFVSPKKVNIAASRNGEEKIFRSQTSFVTLVIVFICVSFFQSL